MATTSAFGWETPDDTDLVKDGAAAIRTLGNSIDTSMAELKGGTTGQVLSKSSNTDMDFTWTNGGDITAVNAGTGISGGGTSGDVTITNSMATAITANGDLIYGTGSGTFTRRAIGTTGQVLTVSGGVPAWVSPAGGGKVLQIVQGTTSTGINIASTTMTDTSLSVTITPSSTSSRVFVMVNQQMEVFRSGGNEAASGVQLLRGGTTVFTLSPSYGAWGTTGGSTNNAIWGPVSFNYLDSPATTSAVTYKIQARVASTGSSGNLTAQSNGSTSVITVMEIGA